MFNLLMDIFFPQNACCICRKPGMFSTKKPWCDDCFNNMVVMQNCQPICQKCGKYLEEGTDFCVECQVNPPQFYIARAVGPYAEPYRIAVKALKFLGKKNLAVCMGRMMAEMIESDEEFWPIDIIVPVPVSAGTMQQRGFNQTELLAKRIGRELKVKVSTNALIRIKETPSQRELTKEEREKNLWCAFKIEDKTDIYRKNVLLVDDVYTTGSTGRECTRTLLEAGAARVVIITWATGKGF